MRTLVIANDDPWPEDSGSRIRLAMVLRGLARCGPVDLVSLVAAERPLPPASDPPPLARFARIGIDPRPPTGPARVAALAPGGRPSSLPRSDQAPVAAGLARFVRGPYDLVWYFTARAWTLAAGALPRVPTVVDLDDLEDRKIAARLSGRPPVPGPVGRGRRWAADALARDEARRWRRLYRRIAGSVDAVALCSELDAGRARSDGVPDAVVVPNGAPWVADPARRERPAGPPVLLFQGYLRYPPNVEAARTLASEVAPRVRRRIPGVEVRLVGDATDVVLSLDDRPAVTVTGRVPDIADELARASAVVVPLRVGSGTRVKILEAFAHRVPVVSTPLGAEGIGAEDGRHLLLGTSADELATATCRVLEDPALASALTGAGRRLYDERFAPAVLEGRVAEVATAVAGGRGADASGVTARARDSGPSH